MKILMLLIFVLFLCGCSSGPMIDVGVEIPAPLALKLGGVEPGPEDHLLEPVRFWYTKTWFEQDLVLELKSMSDGWVLLIRSMTDTDNALESQKLDQEALLQALKLIASGAAISAVGTNP